MKRLLFFPAVLLLSFAAGSTHRAWAEEAKEASPGKIERRIEATLAWSSEEKVDHDYLVFLPDGYVAGEETRKWPMIVYLHGGGGTAKSVEKRLEGLRSEPFVLLAPVCPPLAEGVPGYYKDWNPKIIGAIVRKVIADHAIDEKRVSLMGFSMGGSGAWKTPYWNPDLFDKVVVISGSCHPWYLYHYPKIPVRVYSGENEKWLPQHKHSVESAKSFGVDVTHTIWPGASHGGCCSRTLRDASLRRWLRGEEESSGEGVDASKPGDKGK